MFGLDNVETTKSSHVLEERGTLFVSLSLYVYARMFTTQFNLDVLSHSLHEFSVLIVT